MGKGDIMTRKESEKEYDIFKDSLVRYLGYANEVGESFRVLVPVSLVKFSYVVASTYAFCDAVDKGHRAWKKHAQTSSVSGTRWVRHKKAGVAFTDTLIWQSFASVAIPGFTINRICWFTRICLKQVPRLPQTARYWSVVAVGLGCIPFIVKPIDHGVEMFMNRTLRKLYLDENDK